MKLTGKIQSKTSNSIKINNYWIKFFNLELLQGYNAGDEVEVNYSDKEKDGKTYHNGTSIKLINQVNIQKPKLDTTTLNTIIMCSKDICIELNYKELGFNEVFNELYKTVTEI